MAIEPTPQNIAKAKQVIAEHDQSAEENERIADWLAYQADELRRDALRSRSYADPYRRWLEEVERPSVTEMVTALEDSLADARARSTNYNTPPTGSELDSRAREI